MALEVRRFVTGHDASGKAIAPGFMHRTETLDYTILLSGGCDLELDDGKPAEAGGQRLRTHYLT
jgi:hypothetical protein